MQVRESEIEGYLRKQVEALGGECIKFIPDISGGMPDRVCLLPGGVTIWVETKKPKGGRVAALQTHKHKRMRALGHTVALAYTREDVDTILREIKNTHQP